MRNKALRLPAWGVTGIMAVLVQLMAAGAAAAQPVPPGETAPVAPREYVTDHAGTFAGQQLAYRAIAGETILPDGQGRQAASLFTFSYVKQSVDDPASRPVIFIFNGGPGSASLWLHMGFLGPRKLGFPDAVHPPTVPPFPIVDNPLSLLNKADLVFVDPVGTGFSRLLPGGRAESYLGVAQDAGAIGQFIRGWLTRYKRWDSPKYLLGESYGTVRAAVLANTLMGGALPPEGDLVGITLDGVILIGPGFESGPSLEDRHLASILPSMTAAAWYHGKIDRRNRTLDSAVAEARRFAGQQYLPALFLGSRLDAAVRHRIADRLAALTGIPARTWETRDLRMTLADFTTALLDDRGLQIGIYDSRYTLPAPRASTDPVADDAAMAQYTPGFIAAFNDYMVSELKVPSDRDYVPIAFSQVNFRWNWGAGPGVVVPRNYAAELGKAMRRNPSLRLFIGAGHFDLATPPGNAEFAMTHSAIPLDRVTWRTYPSGHMVYLEEASAKRLAADIGRFIDGAP